MPLTGQSEAKLTSDNIIDYRKSKRVFKELPNDLYDDNLKKILSFFSQKIKDETNCSKLNIVVHHTLVVCNNSKNTTNSPEGVHQDGMDYIVSALVIERRNIFGGKSIIYGADKKSRVFECELREGMSLLQADKNTNLWHEVTNILPLNEDEVAYRSTIGLDFTIVS